MLVMKILGPTVQSLCVSQSYKQKRESKNRNIKREKGIGGK